MPILIYEPCESRDSNERIEHQLHHVIALLHELLDQSVSTKSIEEIQAMTARLKASQKPLARAVSHAPQPPKGT